MTRADDIADLPRVTTAGDDAAWRNHEIAREEKSYDIRSEEGRGSCSRAHKRHTVKYNCAPGVNAPMRPRRP